MKFKIVFATGLFFLVGCAQKQILEPLHLPIGAYEQTLSIETPHGQNYTAKAVLSLKQDHLYLVGLNPVGITAFRIEDDKNWTDPKIEIFDETFEKFSSPLLRLYSALRPVFFENEGPALSSEIGLKVLKRNNRGEALEFQVTHSYFRATIKNKRLRK